jgi:hypothetical protein
MGSQVVKSWLCVTHDWLSSLWVIIDNNAASLVLLSLSPGGMLAHNLLLDLHLRSKLLLSKGAGLPIDLILLSVILILVVVVMELALSPVRA